MNSQISAQRPAGLKAGGLIRVYGASIDTTMGQDNKS